MFDFRVITLFFVLPPPFASIVFPALFGECLVRTNYEKTPSAAADLWACPAMLQLFFLCSLCIFYFFVHLLLTPRLTRIALRRI